MLEGLEVGKGGELWLTDAIDRLAATDSVIVHPIEGRWLTTGDPLRFLKTTVEFALDRPAIAYITPLTDPDSVKCARWNGSVWTREIVDSAAEIDEPSIAIDSSDRPIISYAVSDELRLARWDGVTWSSETLTTSGAPIRSTRLALDSTDRPAIGYREAFAVLREEMSIAEAIDATSRATRQFARRQRTWFRAERGASWLMIPAAEAPEVTAERLLGVA